MRSPFVSRKRFDVVGQEMEALKERHVALRDKNNAVWRDHLSHCDCHDCYDQCPCSETGKHPDGCGCCQWCG